MRVSPSLSRSERKKRADVAAAEHPPSSLLAPRHTFSPSPLPERIPSPLRHPPTSSASAANDLPVARFCADLHREYLEMLGEGSNGNEWTPASMDKLGTAKKDE